MAVWSSSDVAGLWQCGQRHSHLASGTSTLKAALTGMDAPFCVKNAPLASVVSDAGVVIIINSTAAAGI